MDPVMLSQDWTNNLDFPLYEWRFYNLVMSDHAGATEISGVLHPESLSSDRLRAVIEFRIVDEDPVLEFAWGTGNQYNITQSKPIANEPHWRRMIISAPRLDAQPFGPGVDVFVYRNRGIAVRRFDIEDYGRVGDANLDGLVDESDFGIIIHNFGMDQNPETTDGDLNADGVVDVLDMYPIIETITGQS